MGCDKPDNDRTYSPESRVESITALLCQSALNETCKQKADPEWSAGVSPAATD